MVLELSKANKEQSRSPIFGASSSANTVFGLVFILRSRLLVDVFRLFDNFV